MKKQFLKLAIPNILTNLTIPLVSLVDVGLMGRMPSATYIIAIGLGAVIFNFLYWAFGFLRMGTTGFIAQAYGANDEQKISNLLYKGLLVALSIGIILIAIQYPIISLIEPILNIEENVFDLIRLYFSIRIWDAPATISLFVISGWLLGKQKSSHALILAVVVNLFNIIFSYFLVYVLDYNIAGVAWGTVIGQYTGFFFGVYLINVKHKINISPSVILKKGRGRFDQFFTVNRDIFIRTLCLIFTMSFFKIKAASMTTAIGAANILLLEFITISAYGIDGLAFAAESVCGKYYGAKQKAAFLESIRIAFSLSFYMAFAIALAFFFFGEDILKLLTNKNHIIEAALPYLPWLIVAPIINSFAFIWDGIYIGCTSSKAMRNTLIISTCCIFLPCFYLFYPVLGNHGIWLALSLFMFSRGLIQTLLFKRSILETF